MIIHLKSLIYACVVFAGIESIVTFTLFDAWYGRPFFFVVLAIAFFAGYTVGKRVVYAFLPFATTLSAVGLLYFIDNIREQQIFGVLVGVLFYAILLGIKRITTNQYDMTARSLFSAALIATIFLFYATMCGLYINFNIPLWLFLFVQFLFVVIVTFASLRAYSRNNRRIFLYSILIGFCMIQFVWMSNFWPFGYLTMATIILMFYYILWDLVQMEFLELLSKKRIIITILYCIVLSLCVLVTTQWLLIG